MDAQSAYQLSQQTSSPFSGDFVRAVSELPGCLQPVFSGSFRCDSHSQHFAKHTLEYHILFRIPLSAAVLQVLQHSAIRMLSSGLWLRYQHGTLCSALALLQVKAH